MPLCPLLAASFAGSLPAGYLGMGSVNASEAAPREMAKASVSFLVSQVLNHKKK
ncbi:UNVERIFIED_CONTAM: hypothetical protein Sradi_6541700 [Sesamum radiatum]|uniref:Uncharacterized protein n=1 Tax=Sesamum radiatum TaxID=300843 RepID=A0AAW2JW11_SESRA